MQASWVRTFHRAPHTVGRRRLVLQVVLALLVVPLLVYRPQPRAVGEVAARITRVAPATGLQAHGALVAEQDPTPRTPLAGLGLAPVGAEAEGYATRVLLRSAVLDRTLNYWIYVPPGYAGSDQRYPVLYMLHGLGGSSNTWRAWGLFDAADRMIRAKQIAPLIIVAPQGDNGYWMNHVAGGPRWEDYVVQDLVPHIDLRYRTLPSRAYRAVGGVSMGGNGAIRLLLDHPELFGAAAGHSPVFRDQAQAFAFFGTGPDYERRDPVALVELLGARVAGDLWIDMGGEDEWLPRTVRFHEVLLQHGIQHRWSVAPGVHEPSYWEPRIPEYLRWYDSVLRPAALPVAAAS